MGRAIPGSLLGLMLLAGCSSAALDSAEPTEEAILGGVETVEPGFEEPSDDGAEGLEAEDVAVSAQALVDAIMSAGAYTCDAGTEPVRQCTPDEPAAGTVHITGADGDLSVTGEAPIDEDTVGAIADLVGEDPEAIYSDSDGLAWSAS